MKRLHLHVSVPDLALSIQFYETLFGAPATVVKDDYAKWMLEDPRINFAISHRGAHAGLNHLGVQAETADELAGIRAGFAAADADAVYDEPNVTCCYARGNKHWTRDPQGVAWEAFHTLDDVPLFGDDAQPDETAAISPGASATRCCTPDRTVEGNAMPNGCCR